MRTFLAIALALILGVYMLAISNSWYWDYWWFDIPLHLAGGVWLAGLFYYLFVQKKAALHYTDNFAVTLVLALGFVALVGVLWEFYEYLYDVFAAGRHGLFNVQAGLSDTLKDLINDLIGGTLFTASAYAILRRRR